MGAYRSARPRPCALAARAQLCARVLCLPGRPHARSTHLSARALLTRPLERLGRLRAALCLQPKVDYNFFFSIGAIGEYDLGTVRMAGSCQVGEIRSWGNMVFYFYFLILF
jgi:hypothetical protein